MDPNVSTTTEPDDTKESASPVKRFRSLFSRGLLRNLSIGIGGLILLSGLGASIYLSQQSQDIQQHAAANYIPPDGMGIFESCAPYASWCFTNLDTFAAGGMKLVLNYTVFQGATTLADVTAYAARAQQDNIKIIWSLKDMWSNDTDMSLYPELAKESGCTTKSCLAAWVTNQVKGFPATWGYYIADEPTSSQYTTVAALSNLVHAADPNHPRLIIKLDVLEDGVAANAANLAQFAPAAEVLGEDWYPVAYGQNLTNTGPIANEVQYIANTYNRNSTMVLEVNAGNSSDHIHATVYPTETQMAEMLTLVLQQSQPRMVLWYWYPGTTTTQWANLVSAIRTVLSPTVSPTTLQPTPTKVPVQPTPTPVVINTCVGVRSGGGEDKYDDANGPFVNCIKLSACTSTACNATITWQEKNRTKANEYKMVIAPVRPGKTGSYELLTFTNTMSTTLTGFKIGTKYTVKVSAWPSGVFRFGYGTPYYIFTPSQSVSPTPTPMPSNIPTPTISGSVTPNGGITGDLNNDGAVDVLDYSLLVGCYGERFTTPSCLAGQKADLNNDGAVDGIDYNILLRAMIGD